MRRFSLLVVAVLSFAVLTAASVHAQTNSYLKTIKLSWVEAGALTSTAKDTMFVTDEADTARSTPIDFSDIDWAGTVAQSRTAFSIGANTSNPDSTGPIVVAVVEFIATKANNGVSDSLYFNPEQGISGPPSSSCTTCRADTIFSYNPLGVSSGKGVGTTDALSSGFATVKGPSNSANQYNQNVFRGYLLANPTRRGKNDMWGVKRFRLVTCGDVGGTSPKLSGVMGYVTYLAKR